MLEATGNFSLGGKARAAVGLVGEMGQYFFERDFAAKLGIEGNRD
jgi:hypothetical protein